MFPLGVCGWLMIEANTGANSVRRGEGVSQGQERSTARRACGVRTKAIRDRVTDENSGRKERRVCRGRGGPPDVGSLGPF